MRALYLEGHSFSDPEIIITGNDYHHLAHVLRCKADESLLLLNGDNTQALGTIKSIGKKEILLSISQRRKLEEGGSGLNLFLCLPKKETFLEVLRICVELGIESVTPVYSNYSKRYDLPREKIEKVLKGSYEQANRPWKLTIKPTVFLEDIEQLKLDHLLVLASESEVEDQNSALIKKHQNALIGPEGGFSSNELAILRQLPSVKLCRLSTPILRVPTAVSLLRGLLY